MQRSKRALQTITACLAIIPLATGVVGFLGLRDPLYVHFGVLPNVPLDSNLRFFSGVWLGVGVCVAWCVPRIEAKTAMFRALWGMIFLGGIGRVVSVLDVGLPPAPFIGVLALELLGAPLFVLWHRRVLQDASKQLKLVNGTERP